jgi:hypothetical protein
MLFSRKLTAALILGGLCVASTAQAAGSFDGRWSVQLVTERGNCNPTYNWSVAVADGRIVDGGMFVQTAGDIDGRGRVRLQITHGNDVVAAFGKVAGEAGRGAWRSPTLQCSGAWTAQR